MSKYEILEYFVMNGIPQKVGDIVELDYVRANLKSIQGKIKPTTVTVAPKGEEVLSTIIPGKELTVEQRMKLAKENAEASTQAQQMAAEQRARDIAEGKGMPAVAEVANMLKEKLANEEFLNKGQNLPPAAPANDAPPVA